MQGRLGRTAALRNGFQDELPRSLTLWNFAFSTFWKDCPNGVFRNSRPAG
jgi:hypothetical protein